MLLKFYKYEGLENDFVLIDNREKVIQKSYDVLSKVLCSRKSSIGADGMIIIENPTDLVSDVKFIFYNADGTEAEMCGNALRCLTLHLNKIVFKNKMEFIIQSNLVGMYKCRIVKENLIEIDLKSPMIKHEMKEIKVKEKMFKVCILTVGGPHVCVLDYFSNDLKDIAYWGKLIENHELFSPAKTNVHFLKVIDKKNIRISTWERGVGLTRACATGSAASVVSCCVNNLTESNNITVKQIGGELRISFVNNEIKLIGLANCVFEGNILI